MFPKIVDHALLNDELLAFDLSFQVPGHIWNKEPSDDDDEQDEMIQLEYK